jgi:hypothetical protein
MAGGAVVRASILARLLGIRLLRLEAEVRLIPVRFPESGALPGTAYAGSSPALHAARSLVDSARQTLSCRPGPLAG